MKRILLASLLLSVSAASLCARRRSSVPVVAGLAVVGAAVYIVGAKLGYWHKELGKNLGYWNKKPALESAIADVDSDSNVITQESSNEMGNELDVMARNVEENQAAQLETVDEGGTVVLESGRDSGCCEDGRFLSFVGRKAPGLREWMRNSAGKVRSSVEKFK